MPKMRDVRPADAIKAFERAGGVLQPGDKGSHINIKMPNGQRVVIPLHSGPVKFGLLKGVLKKAGLTEDEFMRLLK